MTMGTYPTTPRAAFLEWCQAHAPIFSANAAAIGLTPAQATAFTGNVNKTVTATIGQETARQAALAATQSTSSCYVDLRANAAEVVRSIRTFAENAGNPNVYVLAQIPAPSQPSPAPPPAQPTDLTVTLDATTGEPTLRWKASNPVGTSGTSYIVKRKLPTQPAGGFDFIGVTGTKKFVDTTLIAGPDSVQYTVQGQRADSAGPVSQIFTVNFGRAPGGGLTATVLGEEGMKLAA